MPRIMVIIDGMEERETYPELLGETPYQVGRGKAFLRIEENSVYGKFKTTPFNYQPDSMVCMLTLLGLLAEQLPRGRSFLEAKAKNIPLKTDDLVMRASFVKIDENNKLIDATCLLPKDIAEEIKKNIINWGYKIVQTGGYKNIMTANKGRKFIESIRTYPPHQYVNQDFKKILPTGNILAEDLARLSCELYGRFKPFTIINWSPATEHQLPNFSDIHHVTGAIINKTDIIAGIAKEMNMANVNLVNTTGDTDTNLVVKAKTALSLSKDYDIVIVHINGADEAAHRNSPKQKADFINRIDKEFLAYLLDNADGDLHLMVTSDHGTSCKTGKHSSKPVNFWLYNKKQKAKKNLGTVKGNNAIKLLTDLGENYG